MQVHTFIAETATDAVAQIRARLGSQAVVLNVRQLAAEGLSRLWQKPRIEVLACLPQSGLEEAADGSAFTAAERLSDEPVAEWGALSGTGLKAEEPGVPDVQKTLIASAADLGGWQGPRGKAARPGVAASGALSPERGWRVASVLASVGVLPAYVQRVQERLCAAHGETAPASMADELKLARAVLLEMWNPARPAAVPESHLHIFIGPAGSGKTTVLCKWLAKAVLLEEKPAQVWRLDGRNANASESLSVYCEILGVPLTRSGPVAADPQMEVGLVDLPGVDWKDATALKELGQTIAQYPPVHVHLVLNAAYETSLLLTQARAFASLPVSDLILTHLDEEQRWGKLLNLILGTNYRLEFVSAGQNIPGDFQAVSGEKFLNRLFPSR